MEEISNNVSKIQANLHSSRQRLTTLEANAKISVTTEVSGMRAALKDGDNKIQNTTAQLRSYLSQIEYVTKPEATVDMAPQMNWLHKSLDSIVASLEGAKSGADRAMQYTTAYSYRVLDTGQEVEQSREKLSEYQTQANVLANQARTSLSTSESLLREARQQVTAKEAEIRVKTSEADAKRRRKTELESQIAQKEREIKEAERQQKSKEEDALVGVVSSASTLWVTRHKLTSVRASPFLVFSRPRLQQAYPWA